MSEFKELNSLKLA